MSRCRVPYSQGWLISQGACGGCAGRCRMVRRCAHACLPKRYLRAKTTTRWRWTSRRRKGKRNDMLPAFSCMQRRLNSPASVRFHLLV